MIGRRWASYLALILLIALIGGLAMGSAAVCANIGIALSAIVLGNLVVALPERMAARRSTALLLRAE
jgi:hypothetical protein